MTCSPVLSPRGFTRMFSPLTRVDVRWSALADAKWTVTLSVVDTVLDLAQWYFPWYLASDGSECGWDAPTAVPIAVTDWCDVAAGTSPERRARVTNLARTLRAAQSPVGLMAPTYDLRDGRRLVLDGNHRLAAIVEADLRFVAMEVCLHGAIEREVVPDLAHWESRASVQSTVGETSP
jgi:hypothetical protein